MIDEHVAQPKETVTTVSARCKECGTVWDISRIVETLGDDGEITEETSPIIQSCPNSVNHASS
jgi:hypothetical protein